MNFSVYEHLSLYYFQIKNISASKGFRLWNFLPVNISAFECFSQLTFLAF